MAKKYVYVDTATGRQEADDGPPGGAGSGWTLISAQEVTSAQAAVTFDGVFSDTYDHYEIRLFDVKAVNNNETLRFFWRDGTTDVTTGTSGVAHNYWGSSIFTESISYASGHILSLGSRVGNGTGQFINGFAALQPRSAGTKTVTFETKWYDTAAGGNYATLRGSSHTISNDAYEGIKFEFVSGNIASGRFAVYGLTKA